MARRLCRMGCCFSALVDRAPRWRELLGPELVEFEDSTSVDSLPPPAVQRVAWEHCMELRYRASGGSCAVWGALLHGEHVAVKVLKEDASDEQAWKDIENEAQLLPKLAHRNVVRLIGTGEVDGRPFLVLELLQNTLSQLLPKPFPDEGTVCEYCLAVRRWPLRRALQCGLQLARALRYCHEDAVEGGRLLHRDLKPDNIGFTQSGRLVLFDFGLAKVWEGRENEPRKLTGQTGSTRYMSPEVALSQPYNAKADVFSYATILWQLLAHKRPFSGMDVTAFEQRVARGGERPPVNSGWTEDLKHLLAECWQAESAARPEFAQLVPRI